MTTILALILLGIFIFVIGIIVGNLFADSIYGGRR